MTTASGLANLLIAPLRRYGATIAISALVLAAGAFIAAMMAMDLMTPASAPIVTAPLRW